MIPDDSVIPPEIPSPESTEVKQHLITKPIESRRLPFRLVAAVPAKQFVGPVPDEQHATVRRDVRFFEVALDKVRDGQEGDDRVVGIWRVSGTMGAIGSVRNATYLACRVGTSRFALPLQTYRAHGGRRGRVLTLFRSTVLHCRVNRL